jgi:hypothetical protein
MKRIIQYILAAGLLMATGVQAATVQWVGPSGDSVDTEWNSATNWFGGVLPGYGDGNDVALFGDALDTTVTSPVTSTVWDITLVMRNGAHLDIADDMDFLNMRIGDTGVSGSTVSQSAGMVSVSVDCTVGVLQGSSYALSGSSGLAIDGSLRCGTNGVFSVSGSDALITLGMDMDVVGALDFTLDEAGVSSINVTSNLLVDSDAHLTVNTFGYTGGAASFDLVTFETLSGSFASNNITVLGAKNWSVETNANSLSVSFVPYGPGDTLAVGQDDFDGTSSYASRIVANELDNGNVCFKIVNRDTIVTDEIIDTSVAAGGVVGLDSTDTIGFLGTNKTDNIFGMYRAGASRTLTYTFDIASLTNLNLSMDWAASGSLLDKDVSMTCSIDGAPATTNFIVGTTTPGWDETMDSGTVINNARSGLVLVNGVATNSLTDAFQTYTVPLDGTGSTLSLTFVMTSTVGNFGGMGIDNLKLFGTITGTPELPEIGLMTLDVISGGTQVALSWSTAYEHTYGVRAKGNLTDAWDNIITNIPGTGFDITVTNTISLPNEFYQAYLEE